jgi:hypothetical protein
MKKTFIIVLTVFLSISSLPANAKNAKQATLKNLYFSINYPSIVKLPKSGCASVKIVYKKGIKAQRPGSVGYATAVLISEDEVAALHVWSLNPDTDSDVLLNSGTGALRFCRDDWLNSDGDAFIGISPGIHTMAISTNFGLASQPGSLEELEKTSTIKFIA